MTYPPDGDQLRHLLAQEINTRVDTWKIAFAIADDIVKDPAIRAELNRIEAAHRTGELCGDQHCPRCFQVAFNAGEAVAAAAVCATYVGDHIRCDRCARPLEEH